MACLPGTRTPNLMGLCALAIVARAVNLQVMETDFLQGQGEARFLREVEIPNVRGTITDRHGEPLAVSTPVESVWANPQILLQHPDKIAGLAKILEVDAEQIEGRLAQRAEREFVWLRRRLFPVTADAIRQLQVPGVFLQREYRRFYPTAGVSAQVLGFTNIDDIGQEGLELAYNDWLKGKPGRKRVIKDRRGQIVEDVELLKAAEPGRELRLTIDKRLQYLAYRELQSALQEFKADSGSIVLLDAYNGEILAMANSPSYNPNQLGQSRDDAIRNRAVTDVFEPGSVMKAFTVAAGPEAGVITPTTPVDTNPGRLHISGHNITDMHNYGLLAATSVITKVK